RVGQQPAQRDLRAEQGGERGQVVRERGDVGRGDRGQRRQGLARRGERLPTSATHAQPTFWAAPSLALSSSRKRSTMRSCSAASCARSPTILSASSVASLPRSALSTLTALLRSA